MRTVRTIAELRAVLAPLRADATIGLVPTMGALHDGHLALVAQARAECDVVVVSLFVNPAQFATGEDIDRYPRKAETDAHLAEHAAVDLLFAPPPEEIYPPGFATWVDVSPLGDGLEGEFRPGHFRGVATVCLKLFNLVRPERAYFGEKDAQQVAVVEQLVRDLDLELEVVVVPTVRDDDGVALSSRNVYLSADERRAARAIPRALEAGADAYRSGEDAEVAAAAILAAEPLLEPQYVSLADFNGRRYLVTAVRVGSTRLIDNVRLPKEKSR